MRQTTDVQLIGTSAVIRDLRAELIRVARSDAKVLITGESGCGKEVVAKAIGANSLRAAAPFVPVNCAGLPENLLESELFGHMKGSFTGAYRDKPGKLEMARNGTIFLDEIGEMTPRMQGLLLRFLETGEIQKVGAEQVVMAANVRVIAATNRNLRELITQGLFREDLFFRLNVIHVVVPPLRERREDIPLLVEHFMRNFTDGGLSSNGDGPEGAIGSLAREISAEAMEALCQAAWPGNVRQLENTVFRAVVLAEGDTLGVDEFPQIAAQARSPDEAPVDTAQAPSITADIAAFGHPWAHMSAAQSQPHGTLALLDEEGHVRSLEAIEAEAIRFAISHYREQMSEVARRLQIGRSTLYRKLENLGLDGERVDRDTDAVSAG